VGVENVAACLGQRLTIPAFDEGLVEASDWPSYVEASRPIDELEEIAAMLQLATLDEAILIKFCLSSGFRGGEIRYVTWRDAGRAAKGGLLTEIQF
jgi:hypothetical protein